MGDSMKCHRDLTASDRSRPPVKRFPVDVATLVTCTQTYPRFMSVRVVLREEMDRSHRSPS